MTTNRIVLITGVSRVQGLGYGIAQTMARQGFHVIITARQVEQAESLARRMTDSDQNVQAQALDITQDESVSTLVNVIQETFGRLDILINNAGGNLDYGVHPLETDFKVTRQALEANLFGAWRLVQHFYPLLKQSAQGRIVNISSGAGSFQDPDFGLAVHPAVVTSYGISKLALNGLTVKLACQLKDDGILVNAVDPGLVATADGMEAMGARAVSEAMDGILWAAMLPDDGPSGGFFRDKKPLAW